MSNNLQYIDNIRFDAVDNSDNTDSGTFTCLANQFYLMDTHGTILMPGCSLLSLNDFLKFGWSDDTHGQPGGQDSPTPMMKSLLAFPTNAYENGEGIIVEFQFHTDPHSQMIRQKCIERSNAGLINGVSITFQILDRTRIFQNDFEEELPKYSGQFLQENIAMAQGRPYFDVINEISLKAVAITIIPSNEDSKILEIRSNTNSETSNRNYIIAQSTNTNLNMENRKSVKLSKASHEAISDKLDEMKDSIKNMKDSHNDLKDSIRDFEKSHKETRKILDDLRDGDEKDDTVDKKDDDDDKNDKRSMNSDEFEALVKSIIEKNSK